MCPQWDKQPGLALTRYLLCLIISSPSISLLVPCVSMRPPLCTDADDLLRCSATVGNLGERGEPVILTQVRHWDRLRALGTGRSTRDLHFKHESELHMFASAGKRTPAAWMTGEHATIKPLMQMSMKPLDLKRLVCIISIRKVIYCVSIFIWFYWITQFVINLFNNNAQKIKIIQYRIWVSTLLQFAVYTPKYW